MIAMQPGIAILVAAVLATVGWMFTARRNRTIARKHHTFNVLLTMSFNDVFIEAYETLAPAIKNKKLPKSLDGRSNNDLRNATKIILNHYEFLAAGVRNGDLDEKLLKDSERSMVVHLYEGCGEFIYAVRDNRKRQTINEHLEWLAMRWENNPPNWFQCCLEAFLGRPIQGNRANTR